MKRLPWICMLLLLSCFRKAPDEASGTSVDHSAFDTLLAKHVSEDGLVDYQGFAGDRELLTGYLNTLSTNPPSAEWTDDERLAYWINAYNAFTIDLILTHEPKTSIKEISPVSIPFVRSPWQIDFIKVGENIYNLDDIEHGIIREEFDEPRIHFALVCAAWSCPPLRREAYVSENLDGQLNDQASRFLNDHEKNAVGPDRIDISRIFQWYAEDFASAGGVVPFIQRFVDVNIDEDAIIEYKNYDWRLNSQTPSSSR